MPKLPNRPKILDELEKIASIIPTPVYWEDVNSVILGVNEPGLKSIGFSYEAFVGKSLYELYPKEMADNIKLHNEEVMSTGKILSQEEAVKDVTGKTRYYAAIKAPLRDESGKIIGIVGTSIDITAEKEAERLKIENETHIKAIQEQEKFKNIAEQVAHDIRSPLASLLMIVKACVQIPEAERIALREAAINIGDIANNLLNFYKSKDNDHSLEIEERQSILISATLLQLLADKKYQYHDSSIKFHHDFSQDGNFAFIKIGPSSFKRMISNLINNAVDAVENKEGKVIVRLETTKEWVRITIEDNGKGMSPELIKKIMSSISFTEGKKGGHGLGLTQVRETLERNQGELSFASTVGKGTKVSLTFPRITAPSWIAEEIKLGKNDNVIILDDGASIHRAWDTHFEPILKREPGIKLKHFEMGKEALNYINSLSNSEKNRVFLLSDYELLKQDLNGLNVIEQSKIKRSILVTSHYANPVVLEHAIKIGTKILPKQLASEISIVVDPSITYDDKPTTTLPPQIIVIDDDKFFAKNLILYAFNGYRTEYFSDPQEFLACNSSYPKDIKIYLDNNFTSGEINGVDLAKQLHEQGFTHLYLLTGDTFQPGEVPEYLTVIRKDNIEKIKEVK